MTPETWKTLGKAIEEILDCPSWLRQQAKLDWTTMSNLPVVDTTSNGEDAAPVFEQKMVAPDYLAFLREQIKLGARGPEWSDVLRKRLLALEPFVGQDLMVVMFHCKPDGAILHLNPNTNELVHVEVI